MIKGLTGLLIAAILLGGCGGGGSSSTSGTGTTNETLKPVLTTKVKGKILDKQGEPVAGASIIDGKKTVSSGADGSYELVVSTRSKFAVLVVKKDGYATNAKQVPVATDRIALLDIKLFDDEVRTTFAAASGGTFVTAGEASVKIEPNSVQTADGKPYSGNVTVAVNYFSPDTAEGVEAFPEPYAGIDNGQQSVLRSVGIIEVKLYGSNGNSLQLDAAKPATLTYPATSVAEGVASIPLWYYDEAERIWVREGEATLQDGTYQGTVKHFTLWNADIPYLVSEGTRLKGCAKDADGKPAPYVSVKVRGSGLQLRGLTDAGGAFETYVASGITLRVGYYIGGKLDGVEVEVPPLTSGEVRQLDCQLISSVMKYAGAYSGTYDGNDTGTFNVSITNEGIVTGSGTSNMLGTFSVTGSVAAGGGLSMGTSGTAGGATYSGTIDVATGKVSGTWSGSGTSGNFSGQKQP